MSDPMKSACKCEPRSIYADCTVHGEPKPNTNQLPITTDNSEIGSKPDHVRDSWQKMTKMEIANHGGETPKAVCMHRFTKIGFNHYCDYCNLKAEDLER